MANRETLFNLRIKFSDGTRVSIRAFEAGYYPDRLQSHTRLLCELKVDGKVLFPAEGSYVGIPAHQSVDGDDAKECVLSLFALNPGDTDEEFFADYTPEQLDFVTRYGEELSLVAMDRYGER